MKFKFLLIAFFYSTTISAQNTPPDCLLKSQQENDWKKEGLRGQVKEVTDKWWDVEKKDGRNTPTKLEATYTYFYDNTGKLLKETMQSDTEKGYVHDFKYDANKRLLQENTVTKEKKTSVKLEYYPNGLIKGKTYYNGTVVTDKQVFTYEEACTLTRKDYKNGKLVATRVHYYDGIGNIIRKTYTENNETSEWKYKYDAKNRVIWQEFTSDGKSKVYDNYSYNDEGDAVADDMHQYKYVYDDKGNWIAKVVFFWGEISYALERTITYY